jgi:hypothetical protein
MGVGSGVAVVVAYLGGKAEGNYELWAVRGTVAGFLTGLFLVIAFPEPAELLCRQ